MLVSGSPMAMHRIGLALAAILLLPIVVSGAAWLLSWPMQDKLYYLSIGWVVAWCTCYLVTRMVAWVIRRWAGCVHLT